jgi:hypothetical protein
MDQSQLYMLVAGISLAAIVILLFLKNKNVRNKKLSGLASTAFGCILTGILFGDNRLLGYSLIGVGVILSVIDTYNPKRKIY